MSDNNKLPIALFSLRVSVFLVMFMWTIDKFINPEHAARVYSKFYYLSDIGSGLFLVIGILELVVLIAFLVGYQKRLSYGIVFIFHAVSTFSAYKQYFDPFAAVNLLFFAAWPMLAACFALYLLRDQDTLWSFR